MVGNGLADVRLDNLGALEYWASHALISYETKDRAIEACNLSTTGPLQAAPEPAGNLVSRLALILAPCPSNHGHPGSRLSSVYISYDIHLIFTYDILQLLRLGKGLGVRV